MTENEILDKTADLLEKKKWLQESLAEDANGFLVSPTSTRAVGYCVSGAIFCIMKNEGNVDDTQYLRVLQSLIARNAILHGNNHKHTTVIDWNNDPARTKKEVISALRNAAKE